MFSRYLILTLKQGRRGFHHRSPSVITPLQDFNAKLKHRINILEQNEKNYSKQLQELTFTVEQLSKKCEMRLSKIEKEQLMAYDSLIEPKNYPQHDARSIGSSFIK